MSKYYNKSWLWFLGAFLLYVNTLGHEYTIDDLIVVEKNKLTQEGISAIPEIFSHSYLFGYDGREDESYRPLVLTTFALERDLFDASPFASHLVQVLLYGLTILILFKLLLQLFGENKSHLAAIVALLFMLHPIHTEVVANVKSRDELLCALFLFTALLHFHKWLRNKERINLIFSAFFYFLATLSKETAVPAVILFPAIIWFFEKGSLSQTVRGSLFMILPLGVYALLRTVVLSDVLIKDPIDPVANSLVLAEGASELISTNLGVFTKYVQLAVFPVQMSWDYSISHFPLTGFSNVSAVVGLLILGGLLFLLFYGAVRRSIVGFGALIFVATFAITSNFFFLINCVLGERFLFIPVLGVLLIAVVFMDELIRKKNNLKKMALTILVLFSLYFGIRTILRNADWKNNISIYEAGVSVVPNSVKTQFNLGTEYLEQGLSSSNAQLKTEWFTKSIEHFDHARNIYSKYANVYENMIFVYGEMSKLHSDTLARKQLLLKGRDLALYSLDTLQLKKTSLSQNASFVLTELIAIEKNSDLREVYLKELLQVIRKKQDYTADDLHNEMYALFELNKTSELISLIEKKGPNFPEKAGLVSELSKQYFNRQDFVSSLKILDVYLIMMPEDLSSLSNKGMLLEILGKKQEAILVYEQVLSRDPNNAHTLQLYNQLK